MNPKVGTAPLIIENTILDDRTGLPDLRIISPAMLSVRIIEPDDTVVRNPYFTVVAPAVIHVEHTVTKTGVYRVVYEITFADPVQIARTSEFTFTVDPSRYVP